MNSSASLPPLLPPPSFPPMPPTLSVPPPSVPVTVPGHPSPPISSPSQSPKPAARKTQSKPMQKNRGGSPNYTLEEIKRLLDIVEDELPLGSNEWAVVEQRFNDTGEEIAVMRDQESLRKKFDKMAATKKKTRDPSFPPDVSRAKHIARNINGRALSAMVGDSSGAEEDFDGSGGGSCGSGTEVLGSRKGKREAGARGTKKRRRDDDDDLVIHVETMSNAVSDLVKSMTGGTDEDGNSVDQMVSQKVREELADTKRLIAQQSNVVDELKDMLKTLISSQR